MEPFVFVWSQALDMVFLLLSMAGLDSFEFRAAAT